MATPAANLKRELTLAFPQVKFSVKTKPAGLYVSWVLELETAATLAAVANISDKYNTNQNYGGNSDPYSIGSWVSLNPKPTAARKDWALDKALEKTKNYTWVSYNEQARRFEGEDGKQDTKATKILHDILYNTSAALETSVIEVAETIPVAIPEIVAITDSTTILETSETIEILPELKVDTYSEMYRHGYDNAAIQMGYIPGFKSKQDAIDYSAGAKAGYTARDAIREHNASETSVKISIKPCPSKRLLVALQRQLARLQGKLKFFIKRGIRKIVVSIVFAICKVEDAICKASYAKEDVVVSKALTKAHTHTHSELALYVQSQVESQGQKYYCTDEYKELFPHIKRLLQEGKDQGLWRQSVVASQAMLEADLKWGDRVEWHNIGLFSVEVCEGILINKKGIPWVRLDVPIDGEKTCKWHKGFTKSKSQKEAVSDKYVQLPLFGS